MLVVHEEIQRNRYLKALSLNENLPCDITKFSPEEEEFWRYGFLLQAQIIAFNQSEGQEAPVYQSPHPLTTSSRFAKLEMDIAELEPEDAQILWKNMATELAMSRLITFV